MYLLSTCRIHYTYSRCATNPTLLIPPLLMFHSTAHVTMVQKIGPLSVVFILLGLAHASCPLSPCPLVPCPLFLVRGGPPLPTWQTLCFGSREKYYIHPWVYIEKGRKQASGWPWYMLVGTVLGCRSGTAT